MAQAARKKEDIYYSAAAGTAVPRKEPGPRHQSHLKAMPQSRVRIVPDVAPKKHFFRALICVAAAFAMLAVVVSRYAAISTDNLANLEIQQNINNLETEIEMLEANLAESGDIASLGTRAEALGMGFASNDRIRYLKVEVPVREETVDNADDGFDVFALMARIRSFFE